MKNFFDRPWFYKIVALLCAILLALYTYSYQIGFVTQGDVTKTQQTATTTQTIKVPLQVSVNTDKYYVVGYPEKVSLTLEGSSALVTSTVNTQNFRAYIDLTTLKVGKHRVKVNISGLSNQLTETIHPQHVKVNIQKRRSRSMPVQVAYNKASIASGYEVKIPEIKPGVVNVTGSLSEVNAINKIVANLPISKDTNKTVSLSVLLVALDKKGHQLNVVIDPQSAQVELPINLPSKVVKVKVNSYNGEVGHVYSLTEKERKIRIYGRRSVLKGLTSVTANVNLSGIKANTTKKVRIKLPDSVIKSKPASVTVDIKVIDSSASKS